MNMDLILVCNCKLLIICLVIFLPGNIAYLIYWYFAVSFEHGLIVVFNPSFLWFYHIVMIRLLWISGSRYDESNINHRQKSEAGELLTLQILLYYLNQGHCRMWICTWHGFTKIFYVFLYIWRTIPPHSCLNMLCISKKTEKSKQH